MAVHQNKRILSYDLLRILAAFSVVMLHAAAHTWYYLPIESTDWFLTNAYDASFRFGVPIFVMISGALFLSSEKPLDVKRLYCHNILRLLVLYFIWSCIYGSVDYFRSLTGSFQGKELLKYMLTGRYHLWFLPMIIGIYILLPILKKWVEAASRQDLQYFLLLFVALQILRTTLLCFVRNPQLIGLANAFQVEMVCGYIGYFILGYYLRTYGLPKKYDCFLYLSVPFCLAANIGISAAQSRADKAPNGSIFDSFGLFTFLIVLACFRFFTHGMRDHSFGRISTGIIHEISRDTLGIYVMHLLILEWRTPIYDAILGLPVLLSVPLHALFAFLVSTLLSALLRRIPFVGRFFC